MDICDYREKVIKVAEEIHSIRERIGNQIQSKEFIESMDKQLGILSEFVKDELNISVLKKYNLNTNGDLE